MTREEVIKYMDENPEIPITHELFGEGEFIYRSSIGGITCDENGYVFEDNVGDRNGLRLRNGGVWKDGWAIKSFDELSCKQLYKCDPGRAFLYANRCRNCHHNRRCRYI